MGVPHLLPTGQERCRVDDPLLHRHGDDRGRLSIGHRPLGRSHHGEVGPSAGGPGGDDLAPISQEVVPDPREGPHPTVVGDRDLDEVGAPVLEACSEQRRRAVEDGARPRLPHRAPPQGPAGRLVARDRDGVLADRVPDAPLDRDAHLAARQAGLVEHGVGDHAVEGSSELHRDLVATTGLASGGSGAFGAGRACGDGIHAWIFGSGSGFRSPSFSHPQGAAGEAGVVHRGAD